MALNPCVFWVVRRNHHSQLGYTFFFASGYMELFRTPPASFFKWPVCYPILLALIFTATPCLATQGEATWVVLMVGKEHVLKRSGET